MKIASHIINATPPRSALLSPYGGLASVLLLLMVGAVAGYSVGLLFGN